MIKTESSEYIDELRRAYSIHVMTSRAVISAADGLKTSGRRLLWTAHKLDKKVKTSTLAGSTVPIHPHADAEGPANTLAAFYTNNQPLLAGEGAFGTLIQPKEFGSARYTSVAVSKFARDAVLVDMDIIPMMPNYDETTEEPKHFLPLVPISLLNPSEGIVVGFAVNVLPRTLPDLIKAQIAYLQGKRVDRIVPELTPIGCRSTGQDATGKWVFEGKIARTAHNKVEITGLPYGAKYFDLISRLIKLEEQGEIVEHIDNSSKDINVTVVFKKGALKNYTDAELLEKFKLITKVAEKLTMVDVNGNSVVEYNDEVEVIKAFTDWRLGWYKTRYDEERGNLLVDLQYQQAFLKVVKSGISAKLPKIKTRADLIKEIEKIAGERFSEQLASLPAYRFTIEEQTKIQKKIDVLEDRLDVVQQLLKYEDKRVAQYILELKELLSNFNKGHYATEM